MATVGTLNIDLRMATTAIVAGAAKTTSVIGNMVKSITRSFKSLAGSITPVVDVGSLIGGIKSIATAQSTFIDNTAKLADRLQISTESLVGFMHAADLAGVSTDEMGAMLEKLQKNLGGMDDKAIASLEKLGLTFEDVTKDGVEVGFLKIADAVEKISDGNQRAAIMTGIFGKSGQQLTNTMMAGGKSIREAMQEAQKLGMTFSRFDAAKVEAANDAFTRLKGAIAGIGNTITIGVAPYVEALTKNLTAFASTSGQSFGRMIVSGITMVIDGLQKAYEWVLRFGAKLAEVGMFAGKILNSLGNNKLFGNEEMRKAGMDLALSAGGAAIALNVEANIVAAAPRWSTAIAKSANEAAATAVANIKTGPDIVDKLFGQIATWTEKGKALGGALGGGIMNAMKAADEKWKGIADGIKQAVETPMDAFKRKQDEIDAAFKSGRITAAERTAATSQNFEQLKSSVAQQPQAVQSPSLAIMGTAGAWSAMAQIRNQGRGNSIKDVFEEAKRHTALQTRIAAANEAQVDLFRGVQVVQI